MLSAVPIRTPWDLAAKAVEDAAKRSDLMCLTVWRRRSSIR